MNFKQTVLSFFPWLQSNSASNSTANLEPNTITEANPAPQPPVMMAAYSTKSRKIPGRRSPAGSRHH
ncbi:MAG TPA: hypothetical protein V6C63_11615 [Allocoleopsis sp.]